jgi:anti-anti-sigma factor
MTTVTSPSDNERPQVEIHDCLYMGIYIVRFRGRLTLGGDTDTFQKYFETRIAEGARLFVLDLSGIQWMDSAGVGSMVNVFYRIKNRSGRKILVNPQAILPVFENIKIDRVFEFADDWQSGVEKILGKPSKLPRLKFEVWHLRRPRAEDFVSQVSSDILPYTDNEPVHTERPPIRKEAISVERLSIRGMALVAASALTTLALMVFGLVWVTKQISSVSILVLVFCVALLVSMCLLGLLLLLSGHLSEKTVEKLFSGVLGKIPGLGSFIPKMTGKRAKS